MISYCGCVKLTGEDLSRYFNKIESVGLRKAHCSASARTAIWLQVLQNVHISLTYIMAAKTASIERNYFSVTLCTGCHTP